MKKFILLFAILIGTSVVENKAQAQHISVNININSQPSWGPTGYDYVDYYYLPDINVYYIVNSHRYVYLDRGRWITASYLPSRYRQYDLYGMYKVVLVGGPHNPWVNNVVHRRDYRRYVSHRGQPVIRDSRDVRYNNSRNNYRPWYNDDKPNRASNYNSRPSSSKNNNVYRQESTRSNRDIKRDTRSTNSPKVDRPSRDGKSSTSRRESRPSQRNSSSNYKTVSSGSRR